MNVRESVRNLRDTLRTTGTLGAQDVANVLNILNWFSNPMREEPRATGPDRTATVYLNGTRVDSVLAADEVNGVVVRIAFDSKGGVMMEGGHIMSVTQYGNVRVVPKG